MDVKIDAKATDSVTVFGEHEQKVVDQLERCVRQEEGSLGVLCADGHFGYSAPIGGVVAYREHVSPAAVGYDIGCGNMAVATSVLYDGDFQRALPGLMDRVYSEVSFGMGRADGGVDDHPVFDAIARADYAPQRELLGTARKQLGTVGAGNHYVDLFADTETNRVWVGVHFGSRGFGHKTATAFLAIAAQENGHKYREGGGEMEAPPDLLHVGGGAGQTYLRAMELAGKYAYAGREVVVAQVLGILGAEQFGDAVHNHHNYAWTEVHDGETFHVIRKGATPAFPGQAGFVGGSMEDDAVILEGVDSHRSAVALYSTVHGAGRAMSRTAAAGKSRKRWTCLDRDCDWVQGPGEPSPVTGGTARGAKGVALAPCPKCGNERLRKQWVHETKGAVDWDAVTRRMSDSGIELRGANAEEAPEAYKRLPEVLAYHEGTVSIVHRLRPVGVAMAPGDTRDAYKD